MERCGLVGTIAVVEAPSPPSAPNRWPFAINQTLLEKSAKKALSITFGLPRGPGDAPLLPLITPYLSQSQHLTITSSRGVPDREPRITHDHFPLLKNLELPYLSLGDAALEGQPTIVGLEGMGFPWAQLTQLTIQFHTTIEALSSAELTSLTLRGIRCSLRNLIYLSARIPMVTDLDLWGIDLDSCQLLTIKSDSPHGTLFPRLERLVIRDPASFNARLSLNMFHSRLYLAPNATIIENMSPLQYAELHIPRIKPVRHTGIYCTQQFYWQESNFTILIRCLRGVYSKTAGFNRNTLRGATEHNHEVPMKVICDMNQHIFPAQYRLGYCSGKLLAGQTTLFFQKLDAAFTELEGCFVTHASEILGNDAHTLMREFSGIPATAFLHHPTYKFHIRAARLLEQWQPMIGEYDVEGRWLARLE
ncbi:hypothetical protein BD779DRAFT_1682137 [Infundibulicybe gibba]|nr:hypothetical protein BD779DRAFT_1682137 [Infundibulicybe gibba]